MNRKLIIELVKKLREETGLGVMEIKAAVEEAGGDENRAKQILKEKGFEKAAKKAERETRQGRVATYTHTTGKVGVMVELLCETDFVARNEEFVAMGKDLCLQVAAMEAKTAEELLEQEFIKDPSKKISELVAAMVAKFGENIKVGKVARFEI